MGMHGSFTNNKRNAFRRDQKALMESIMNYVVPHVYSAFCLVLYDKYGWEPEQITECVKESEELWDRSTKEGWDIKQNCLECTGIDVIHFRDTGRINKIEVEENDNV